MAKTLIRQLLAGLMIGGAVIAGFYLFTKPYAYQGSLIEPPLPAADFSLTQADGGTFRLSNQKGNLVLLYFGYTYCPDVCPTTMYDIAKAKAWLGEDASKIQVVLVTVDPERDTTEHLDEYVTVFDPAFIGLSGSIEELESIWSDYGVYREKAESDGATSYLINHTARIFVVDTNGNLRLTFPFGMASEAMADDLAHLLDSE